jgi:hypothetical protein
MTNYMKEITFLTAIFIMMACPAYSQQRTKSYKDFRDFVTALPSVDRVDILKVSTLQADDRKKVDCTRNDLVCGIGRFPLMISEDKTLSGGDATKIVTLWRKLKRGNSGGCFSPARVLRFYRGDQLLLETEVCLYCRKISLPNEGIVSISGNLEALYGLMDLLTPNSSDKATFENFKSEMMPHVNQQVTIIGILGDGKLGFAIPFKQWHIYLYGRKDSDLAKENALNRYRCHTVKVTGRLRYHAAMPPPQSAIPVAVAPEHFYLDISEVSIFNVYPR